MVPARPLTRVAVVGCGHFGHYHATKYAADDTVDLVAVVDRDPDRAAALAVTLGVPGHGTLDTLDLGRIDAASVVVPTADHFEVAERLLTHGVHVLIEKPIAATHAQAQALIDLARHHQRLLQVGHLERFNAAVLALGDVLLRPLFIESTRIAPFKPRGTDVDVVLDLMIHDVDLIQELVGAPLESVDAVGVPVLSPKDDIANARLRFEGGCVANVTASRVSLKSERKMRVFQADTYVSIDFQEGQASIARKGSGEMFPGVPDISLDRRQFGANDPLKLEIEAFLAAVRGERPVAVSGADGLRALDAALKIAQAMQRPI